jgi:hypothetical protein
MSEQDIQTAVQSALFSNNQTNSKDQQPTQLSSQLSLSNTKLLDSVNSWRAFTPTDN